MARIFNASTGTRPTGWSVSRTTAATYLHAGGLIATASANTERLEYNSAATLLGLLIEPSGQNFAAKSNDLGDASAWLNFANASGVIGQTSNAGTAPDGNTTAALLTVNRSSTADYAEFYQAPAGSAGAYGGSLYVKANGAGDIGKQIAFFLYDGIGVQHIIVTLTAAWQKVSNTATLSGSPQIGFGYVPATGMGGTGLISFLAWGGQLETGAVNTSLIPTTTGTGSRGADDYSFTLDATATSLTFTFDDASTQTISGLTGGSTYHILTSLNRSHILYIDDNSTGGGSASGSGSYTEAGDTGSGSGASGSSGSGAYTEGADTGSGAGTRGASGSGSYTEAGDTGAGSGASGSSGSGAYTEAGDTATGSGTAIDGQTGFGGATEPGDTGSGSGASGSTGSGSFTEPGDIGSGTGSSISPATGSGSYTEVGDTGSGSGQTAIPATGSGSYSEPGDTGAGSGRVPAARQILQGPSVGIDRRTGRVLVGFPHVRQSMGVIFTTRIGERVMRRTFGSNVPGMLGKNLTKRTVLRFAAAVIVALDFWEPRFAIKQISFEGNSPEKMRQGGLRLRLVGEYRPRAHLGDFTPEGAERTIEL